MDDVFAPNFGSLFDANITEKLKEGTLLPKRKKRRNKIYNLWKENCEWRRPVEVYGPSNFCVFGRVEAQDVT